MHVIMRTCISGEQNRIVYDQDLNPRPKCRVPSHQCYLTPSEYFYKQHHFDFNKNCNLIFDFVLSLDTINLLLIYRHNQLVAVQYWTRTPP